MTPAHLDRLKHELAKTFKVSVKDIDGPRKQWNMAFARQVGMFILTGMGFHDQAAAKMFNRNTAGTALNARRQVLNRMETNAKDRKTIERLQTMMNSL